jgi:acyl-CoA synthetase (AMP-forming)/AMP-acid ligase II
MGPHQFTLYDMLVRSAHSFGNNPAVIAGERAWTYREFLRRVDSLAAGLAAMGLVKGDRLCILAQNDPAYLEVYGACARQGIVVYPINWRLTGDEVARVAERAQPKAFLVDAESASLVAGIRAGRIVKHWLNFSSEEHEGVVPLANLYISGPGVPRADVAADDPFAVISTAAVDVIPRGAVLSHGNLLAANLCTLSAMGFTDRDRYLVALPLFHITALGSALAHLHAGGANVVVSRFDAAEAVRLIDRHAITHVSDFPPVLVNLLEAAGNVGSRLATLTHVSGLDRPETIQKLHEQTAAQFWTGFGQSETSGFVSLQRVSERPGAAGKPALLAQLRLVDDYDRDVSAGSPGEILVQGPVVFQGYFGQPDATAYTFRGGWHHTGDVGRFDAEGYLHYVKRKAEKELIKPGGENVYPAEVESVIMELPKVSAVCVFGVPDVQWGEAIKAVVETDAKLAESDVIDHVGSRIARFKKPKWVAFAAKLPRTAEGAVDREAVKSRWGRVD